MYSSTIEHLKKYFKEEKKDSLPANGAMTRKPRQNKGNQGQTPARQRGRIAEENKQRGDGRIVS